MKRYYVIFSGRVQGVGFRYHVKHLAGEFGLTGWVRNLNNGNVDMEVQGQSTIIQAFIKSVREGNGFIRVEDYSMKEIPMLDAKDETQFRVF